MSCGIGFAGRDPITGESIMAPVGKGCQRGGKIQKKKRSRKLNNKNNSNKPRKSSKYNKKRSGKKKISKKKLDMVIDKLCSKMKRRCTPKYKSLLKKIVMKHL